MAHETFKLPLTLISPVDLKRSKRELDNLSEQFLQANLKDDNKAKLPPVSQLLTDIASINKLDLTQTKDRDNLAKLMDQLIKEAPVVHISFASEPSPQFLSKLIDWLRRSIDSYVLMIVGLNPSIGAGCIVRTENKYFDLSLRQALTDSKPTLIKDLGLDQLSAQPAEAAK